MSEIKDMTDEEWAETQRRLGLPIVTREQIKSFYDRNKDAIIGALEMLNKDGSHE